MQKNWSYTRFKFFKHNRKDGFKVIKKTSKWEKILYHYLKYPISL